MLPCPVTISWSKPVSTGCTMIYVLNFSSGIMPAKADGARPRVLTGCAAEMEAWEPSFKVFCVWLLIFLTGTGNSFPEV